jgi:hypothetical protein
MATRLLLVVMLVFAALYGCAQVSSPAERQEHRAPRRPQKTSSQ